MSQSWLPLKDAVLLSFVQNMSTKITAAPTTYGLVAGDATALAALLATYNTTLTAAVTPATRTPVTVAVKDVAKAALVADVRALARRIQATLSVTPDQKIALGLPIHKTTVTPNPAPSTKPMINVVGNAARTVSILIKDETTPNKKAKPPGYEGAEIYYCVPAAGEQPPADLTEWSFAGLATRGDFDVNFRPADVAKTAYILANWYNARGESGPACEPTPVSIAA